MSPAASPDGSLWRGRVREALMRWLGLALLLLGAGAARAGTPDASRDLCPDRPGKGTPPCILDVGHWQLEVGAVDFQHGQAAGVTTDAWSWGGLEARLGL